MELKTTVSAIIQYCLMAASIMDSGGTVENGWNKCMYQNSFVLIDASSTSNKSQEMEPLLPTHHRLLEYRGECMFYVASYCPDSA